MELEDNIRRERHIGMVGMNCRKGIPVAGNLLLRSVLWGCFMLYDLLDALRRRLNSFYTVRGFGALDYRHLAQ